MGRRLFPGAALCILPLALAACGASKRVAEKQAVNDYITRVDVAEAPLMNHVGEINIAFAEFKLGSNPRSEVTALLRARTLLDATLRRVRGITAPPQASRLRGEVVSLLTLEGSVAGELVEAARFGPRFDAAVNPLRAAAARLGKEIAAIKAPPAAPVAPSGLELWTASGCGACHTFAAARSTGEAGPNLDLIRPSSSVVAAQLEHGGVGMPAYAVSLSAAEIASLAVFVAAQAGAPAGSASSSAAPTGTAQVAQRYSSAFARYRRAIDGVAAEVGTLTAPPLLEPVLTAERAALARSSALCGTIEKAFTEHRFAAATAGIDSLFAVATGLGSAQTRNAQARAARAYDARVAAIAALAATVATERERLVKLIG